MNIAKMILLASPVFLASLLLLGKPAQASSLQRAFTTHMTSVYSHPWGGFTTLHVSKTSNPIMDQLGCNCATCVQSKLEMLQGRLPSVDF